MPHLATHIAPDATLGGKVKSVACTRFIFLAIFVIPLSANVQAQDSSLDGRWVADGDRNFILNIDAGEVEGSYFCRHQPMGVRGEISADGTLHAWGSNMGTPSQKTKLTGKFPTVTISDYDYCPGDRKMHRE